MNTKIDNSNIIELIYKKTNGDLYNYIIYFFSKL